MSETEEATREPALTWVSPGKRICDLSVLLPINDQPIATAQYPSDNSATNATGAPKPDWDTPTNPQPPRFPATGAGHGHNRFHPCTRCAGGQRGAVHVIHGGQSSGNSTYEDQVDDNRRTSWLPSRHCILEIPQPHARMHHVVCSHRPADLR